jgi:hypothetical protein
LIIALFLLCGVARRRIKIGGFVRKLKADAHPVSGIKIALVQRGIKQRPDVSISVHQLQKPVKMLRDGEDFVERSRGIDAIKQSERNPAVEAGVSGLALFPDPCGLFALNGDRHQLISDAAAGEKQGRFPAQIEGISPRPTAQRISRSQRFSHCRRSLCDDTIVGQMGEESRPPPRRPSIGPCIITQPRCCRPQRGGIGKVGQVKIIDHQHCP